MIFGKYLPSSIRDAFVNGRQKKNPLTQWYYVAYMGSRTSEKIFTNHRD
jgi:hypothetical protein